MERSFRPGRATRVSDIDVAPSPVPGRNAIVQAKREVPGGATLEAPRPAPEPAAADEASGGGAPLPAPVRSKMEAAFGADFSAVRIHEGPQAAQFGAIAYARGENIYFQPGRYDPMSPAGQELLGHELTHVVQQRAGRVASPQGKLGVNADPALEAEADAHGARAARGEVIGGGAQGPAGAHGDGPRQLVTNLTGGQLGALTRSMAGEWRYVTGALPHITIFLDQASKDWLAQEAVAGRNHRGPGNSLDVASLNGHALTYDELHYTVGAKHFYYSDAGVPLAASPTTGAGSPAWDDAAWSAANRRVAAFLGLDRFALNVLVNAHGGGADLPASQEIETQREQAAAERERVLQERINARRLQPFGGMVPRSVARPKPTAVVSKKRHLEVSSSKEKAPEGKKQEKDKEEAEDPVPDISEHGAMHKKHKDNDDEDPPPEGLLT